jgi:hypothetical protein
MRVKVCKCTSGCKELVVARGRKYALGHYSSAVRSKLTKKSWKNSLIRRKRTKGIRKTLGTQIVSKKRSKISKDLWATDSYRENVINGVKEKWNSLDWKARKKCGKKIADVRWENEERGKEHSRALKLWWKKARRSGRVPVHKRNNGGVNYSLNKREWVYSRKAAGWFYCRSSWEKRYLLECEKDTSCVSCLRPAFSIWVKVLQKDYRPDFFVLRESGEALVVEIKPKCRVDEEVKAKSAAARVLCRKQGMKFEMVSYD